MLVGTVVGAVVAALLDPPAAGVTVLAVDDDSALPAAGAPTDGDARTPVKLGDTEPLTGAVAPGRLATDFDRPATRKITATSARTVATMTSTRRSQ